MRTISSRYRVVSRCWRAGLAVVWLGGGCLLATGQELKWNVLRIRSVLVLDVTGQVTAGEGAKVKPGDEIKEGTTLSCADGAECDVHAPDVGILRLRGPGSLELPDPGVARAADQAYSVKLVQGTLYVSGPESTSKRPRKLTKREKEAQRTFQVQAPLSMIWTKDADFSVSVAEAADSVVVNAGELTVRVGHEEVVLKERQQTTATAAGPGTSTYLSGKERTTGNHLFAELAAKQLRCDDWLERTTIGKSISGGGEDFLAPPPGTGGGLQVDAGPGHAPAVTAEQTKKADKLEKVDSFLKVDADEQDGLSRVTCTLNVAAIRKASHGRSGFPYSLAVTIPLPKVELENLLAVKVQLASTGVNHVAVYLGDVNRKCLLLGALTLDPAIVLADAEPQVLWLDRALRRDGPRPAKGEVPLKHLAPRLTFVLEPGVINATVQQAGRRDQPALLIGPFDLLSHAEAGRP